MLKANGIVAQMLLPLFLAWLSSSTATMTGDVSRLAITGEISTFPGASEVLTSSLNETINATLLGERATANIQSRLSTAAMIADIVGAGESTDQLSKVPTTSTDPRETAIAANMQPNGNGERTHINGYFSEITSVMPLKNEMSTTFEGGVSLAGFSRLSITESENSHFTGTTLADIRRTPAIASEAVAAESATEATAESQLTESTVAATSETVGTVRSRDATTMAVFTTDTPEATREPSVADSTLAAASEITLAESTLEVTSKATLVESTLEASSEVLTAESTAEVTTEVQLAESTVAAASEVTLMTSTLEVTSSEATLAESTPEATSEALFAEGTTEVTTEVQLAESTVAAVSEFTLMTNTLEVTSEAALAESTLETTSEAFIAESTTEITTEVQLAESTIATASEVTLMASSLEVTSKDALAESTLEATSEAFLVESTTEVTTNFQLVESTVAAASRVTLMTRTLEVTSEATLAESTLQAASEALTAESTTQVTTQVLRSESTIAVASQGTLAESTIEATSRATLSGSSPEATSEAPPAQSTPKATSISSDAVRTIDTTASEATPTGGTLVTTRETTLTRVEGSLTGSAFAASEASTISSAVTITASSVICVARTLVASCFGNNVTLLPVSSVGQRINFTSDCYAQCTNNSFYGALWVIYDTRTTESGAANSSILIRSQTTTVHTFEATATTPLASGSIALPNSTTSPTVARSSVSQSLSTAKLATTTNAYVDTDKAIQALRSINQVGITAGNARELAETVQSATSYADNLSPAAVADASSIVNKLADLISSGSLTPDLYPVPGYIGKIVGNLLNANETVLASAQSQSQVSIQESLEKSLYALAEAASQNGSSIDDSFLRLQEDNLAFQVIRNSAVCGLTISDESSLNQASITPIFTNDSANYAGHANDTVVKLSHLVANGTKTFLVYNNAKLFQTNSSSLKADMNTRVLSAQIAKTSNRNIAGLISMTFTGLSAVRNGAERQCGYWDYTNGSWSSDGCKAIARDDDQVECVCEHLTNFAALLAINDVAPNAALDLLSTIGLSLSVASLAAVVITFVCLRRMRRTVSQKVLFNLALSLMLLDALFLLGINSTQSKGGCIAVAALLHYFLLTSFMWMLMESILQYLRFVKVLGTYIPKFILKTAIPAWCGPAIVVAIICGVNLNLYDRGNSSYCLAQEVVIYYAVLLPIGLIITVNWIIFAIVLKHFCCRSRHFAYQGKGSESSLAQLHAQAGIAICTLLGLTWIFGFLTAIPDVTASLAFQWLFCICNTLQGFLIFVFHCIREPAVRKEWKKLCCKTEVTSQRSITYSSEDSVPKTRSTTSMRSQVYSVSSEPSRAARFANLRPSHTGSYDLWSVGGTQ